MDKIKDTYNDVIKSWRRRSIGLSLYIKLNINSSFEGAFDADSHSIGNPTEFKQNLKVTVGEDGDLIGSVISTFA